eukprot:13193809-Alexandrium_andersonii.AAC.1
MDRACKLRIFRCRLALAGCSPSRCKLQRKLQHKLRGQPRCRSICRLVADRGSCTCIARATC